jgi:hypothetical protein
LCTLAEKSGPSILSFPTKKTSKMAFNIFLVSAVNASTKWFFIETYRLKKATLALTRHLAEVTFPKHIFIFFFKASA